MPHLALPPSTPTSAALVPCLPLARPTGESRPDYATKLICVGRDGRACVVWTDRREWEALLWHLHNGRGERDFVVAWPKPPGLTPYARNRSRTLATALDWTWKTVEGRRPLPFGLAFYSQNENGQSRWGCMDFDAHGPDKLAEAWQNAARCFGFLKSAPGLGIILEFSGRGYHLWLIAKDFRPVEAWAEIMLQTAAVAGVPVGSGTCEIYPLRRAAVGKAVRVPGSWNPATGECSEIIRETCAPLLSRLTTPNAPPAGSSPAVPYQATALSGNQRRVRTPRNVPDVPESGDAGRLHETRENSFLSSHPPTAVPSRSGASEASRVQDAARLLEKHRIREAGTRNAMLGKLAGELFGGFGETVAGEIVRAHHGGSLATLNADEPTHLAEFTRYWQGSAKSFHQKLNAAEYDALKQFAEDPTGRDAFRILWHWATLAASGGEPDFALSVESMGGRLGVTRQGATKVRDRLVGAGVILRTCRHDQSRRAAARYAWQLG